MCTRAGAGNGHVPWLPGRECSGFGGLHSGENEVGGAGIRGVVSGLRCSKTAVVVRVRRVLARRSGFTAGGGAIWGGGAEVEGELWGWINYDSPIRTREQGSEVSESVDTRQLKAFPVFTRELPEATFCDIMAQPVAQKAFAPFVG